MTPCMQTTLVTPLNAVQEFLSFSHLILTLKYLTLIIDDVVTTTRKQAVLVLKLKKTEEHVVKRCQLHVFFSRKL